MGVIVQNEVACFVELAQHRGCHCDR